MVQQLLPERLEGDPLSLEISRYLLYLVSG
jgi:hypothetical protein